MGIRQWWANRPWNIVPQLLETCDEHKRKRKAAEEQVKFMEQQVAYMKRALQATGPHVAKVEDLIPGRIVWRPRYLDKFVVVESPNDSNLVTLYVSNGVYPPVELAHGYEEWHTREALVNRLKEDLIRIDAPSVLELGAPSPPQT